MKTLSGAVLVLAAAVLYSGVIIEGALQKRGSAVELVAIVIGMGGIVLLVAGLFQDREPRQ